MAREKPQAGTSMWYNRTGVQNGEMKTHRRMEGQNPLHKDVCIATVYGSILSSVRLRYDYLCVRKDRQSFSVPAALPTTQETEQALAEYQKAELWQLQDPRVIELGVESSSIGINDFQYSLKF